MSTRPIQPLRMHPDLLDDAAAWFSGIWDVPAEAYRESMRVSVEQPHGIPQWYVVLDDDGRFIAGCGVIDNDFHERKDLAPNLCALYVDPAWRECGIARRLLDFARAECGDRGYETLYLVTDHETFYERCGWTYRDMVAEDEGGLIRLYSAPTMR